MSSDQPATVNAPVTVAEGITLIRCPNPGPMTLDGTNTYVLTAAGGYLIVDPGPADPDHLAVVADTVGRGSVRAIVLSHGHDDHSGGAGALSDLLGAPVLARSSVHGRPLPASGGVLAQVLTVVDAPGHSADSVCFLYRSSGDAPPQLLTGDTILGRGTTVVAHPDGRLVDYLRTLENLQVAVRTHHPLGLLPGHGPIRANPAEIIDGYRQHRVQRLVEIQAAIAAGHTSPGAVVARVYAEVDPVLWPAAELSVRAQLDYLAEQPA